MYKLKTNRGFWQTLLLTIVTLGFYQWYLIYAFAKETNIVCKDDGKKTPGLIVYVLLSIITLGIYAIVWRCMWIKRCNSYLRQNGKPKGLRISTYLSIVLGCLIFYVVTIFAYDSYVSSNISSDVLSDVSLYLMALESSNIVLIARLLSCAQLILLLICWTIIIYKQLYLQNSVNNLYNESIIETTESTNNEIPPTVKRYRTIATIFTTLILISTSLIHLELMSAIDVNYIYAFGIELKILFPVLVVLSCIPVFISLFKIGANKATQNAVIVIFSTVIVQHLCYLLSLLINNEWLHIIIYYYLPILYYILVSYAISIILRNNRFEKDSIKKTWIALLSLFWINGRHIPIMFETFTPLFSIIFIPACFCAIHSSAFYGASEEKVFIAKPYAAINRYTIAAAIVCGIIYIIPIVIRIIFNIIAHYR